MSTLWAGVLLPVWLAAVLAGVAVLRRRRLLAPEPARKAVHAALGLTAAAFPWLFARAVAPVWAVCLLATAALLLLRRNPRLRRGLGGALHDVNRRSLGDLLFPLAVALCWTLAPGDPIGYSLPLLVLAVADSLAALVGKGYGHLAYSSSGDRKTWEGSLAFALVTFLLAEVPLLLSTELGRGACLLIALNLAVLLMLVEALAWEGSDNLLIPLAGLLALRHWLILPVSALAAHSAALLLLAAACWAGRRWTTLDDAAVLACGVIGYVTWVLGGMPALVAPWTLFLAYARLYPPRLPEHGHRALIPLAIATPSLGWLLMEPRLSSPSLGLLAAAAAYATQMACIGLVHGRHEHASDPWLPLALRCWLRGQLLVLLPTLVLTGPADLLGAALAAALGGLAALLAFGRLQPCGPVFPVEPVRWLRQSLLVGTGSAAVVLVV